MTSTRVHRTLAKGLAAVMLAGAFLLASPQKASAQQFAVGVQFGQPAYGYDDGRRDYWQHERWEHERAEQIARHEAWERQQAYAQHEAWERQQGYLRHEAWEHRDAYEHGFGEARHDRDRGYDRDRGHDRDWDRGR